MGQKEEQNVGLNGTETVSLLVLLVRTEEELLKVAAFVFQLTCNDW